MDKKQGIESSRNLEGRDAAGKGCYKANHPAPESTCLSVVAWAQHRREKTQWYFSRSAQLPCGEMVLFDRSWNNRAGGWAVMSFCTDEEYHDSYLMPEFERMLIRSGFPDQIWFRWVTLSRTSLPGCIAKRQSDALSPWFRVT